jgi:hypothetical protein
MRILITGSRNWPDDGTVEQAILDVKNWFYFDWEDVVIVHGDCPTGADAIADEFATEYDIKVERHPADWKKHGRAAGPIRNQEMVDLGADICLAFPLPDSRGTIHCMKAAKKAGIPVKLPDGSLF